MISFLNDKPSSEDSQNSLVLFRNKNPYKKIYRAYFFYSFFALLWVIANSYFQSHLLLTYGEEMAKIMALIATSSSVLAIVAFYTLSLILKSPNQKLSRANLIFIGVLTFQSLIINFVPELIISEVKIFPDGNFQLVFGFVNNILFLEAFFILILAFLNFVKAKKVNKKHLEHIKFIYILLGMSVIYGSLIIFHLIFPAIFENYQYVWIPPALTILNIGIMTHHVLAYRFKSVKLFLSKLIKIFIAAVIALFISVLFHYILPNFIKENFSVELVTLIVVILAYEKIYSWFHSEKFYRIFGMTYVEYFHKVVKSFQTKQIMYITLKELKKDLEKIFCKRLKISKVEILLANKKLRKQYPYLTESFKEKRKILVTKEVEFIQEQNKQIFPFFKELKSLGEVCLPLHNPSGRLVGIFVLGKKPFDTVYTKEEIESIENASSYLSLNLTGILYNSELKKEVIAKTEILLQKNQELELKNDQISMKNKEISQLLSEKVKLLAQQSDFIAVTGHELKTPLAIALLRSDHMIQNHLHDLEIKEEAEGIKKALNRLRAIIEKLYDILQYDLNKINITPEKIKIYEFLERIYEDFSPLMEEKKLKFVLDNKFQRESFAFIDPVYMRQLMQNLIVNAIKFSPIKSKITLSGKEDRKSIFFSLADQGEGVPDKTKEEIFEKFKTNHKMHSPGLGLGLYICRKIADLHGGKIWVEDNKNGGAIFQVQIPKKKDNQTKILKEKKLAGIAIPTEK